MNSGRNAFPASIVETVRKRSSLTSRSCSVLFIRSTRPFACGEFKALHRLQEAQEHLREALAIHRRSHQAQLEGDALALLREIALPVDDSRGAAARGWNEVIEDRPGVVWIRSYVSEVEGKIYCEYDAPSAEAVLEHARRAGLPVDRMSEIALEISPAMFR